MKAPAPGDKSPIASHLCALSGSLCAVSWSVKEQRWTSVGPSGGAQQRTLDSSTAVEFYFHLNHETDELNSTELMNFIYFPPPSVNVQR